MSEVKCFGHYQPGKENCLKCEFCTSCQMVTKTEGKIGRILGGQNFDEVAEFDENLVTETDIYAMENETNMHQFEKQNLVEFLNFLFHLDNYTLGILAEIVAPAQKSERLTVAQMARIHGISRQGMHRKILDIARKSPELSSLLKCVILKIRKSRLDFRKGPCHKKRKSVSILQELSGTRDLSKD